MEKLYKNDIIRKDTVIGDVMLSLRALPRENRNIVYVFCYMPKSGDVIYTEDDYIDGMDKEEHIDKCIPILLELIKDKK